MKREGTKTHQMSAYYTKFKKNLITNTKTLIVIEYIENFNTPISK